MKTGRRRQRRETGWAAPDQRHLGQGDKNGNGCGAGLKRQIRADQKRLTGTRRGVSGDKSGKGPDSGARPPGEVRLRDPRFEGIESRFCHPSPVRKAFCGQGRPFPAGLFPFVSPNASLAAHSPRETVPFVSPMPSSDDVGANQEPKAGSFSRAKRPILVTDEGAGACGPFVPFLSPIPLQLGMRMGKWQDLGRAALEARVKPGWPEFPFTEFPFMSPVLRAAPPILQSHAGKSREK